MAGPLTKIGLIGHPAHIVRRVAQSGHLARAYFFPMADSFVGGSVFDVDGCELL